MEFIVYEKKITGRTGLEICCVPENVKKGNLLQVAVYTEQKDVRYCVRINYNKGNCEEMDSLKQYLPYSMKESRSARAHTHMCLHNRTVTVC